MQHVVNTVLDLDARGIGFRSLMEAIDLTSSTGKLLLSVFGWLGEVERELTMECTKAGLAAAKRRGVQLGRRRKLTTADGDHARRMIDSREESVAGMARTLKVGRNTLGRALKRQVAREARRTPTGPAAQKILEKRLSGLEIVPVVMFPPSLLFRRSPISWRPFQFGPEPFEIHRTGKRFQLISKVAQPGKPLINIENSPDPRRTPRTTHGKSRNHISALGAMGFSNRPTAVKSRSNRARKLLPQGRLCFGGDITANF